MTRVFSKLLPGSIAAAAAAATPWRTVRVCVVAQSSGNRCKNFARIASTLQTLTYYRGTQPNTHSAQTKSTDNMENRMERLKTNAFWCSEAEMGAVTAVKARGKRTTFVCFGYTSTLDSAIVRFVEWLLF